MMIHHVVLWVEDARRSLEFYTKVVGLPGVRTEEFAAGQAPFPSVRVSESAILDSMPQMMAPIVSHFEAKPTAAGKAINHVCLAMTKGQLDAIAARLAEAGVATQRMGDRNDQAA